MTSYPSQPKNRKITPLSKVGMSPHRFKRRSRFLKTVYKYLYTESKENLKNVVTADTRLQMDRRTERVRETDGQTGRHILHSRSSYFK